MVVLKDQVLARGASGGMAHERCGLTPTTPKLREGFVIGVRASAGGWINADEL
jgi:hypothetical protein